MKHSYRLLLPILCYLISFNAAAQSFNSMIFGAIRDHADKIVLPGASIKILENNAVMNTDNDGHFHFNTLCPGEYTLQISYVGYLTREILVSVNGQKEIDILLTPTANHLKNVQISGFKEEVKPLQTVTRLEGRPLEMNRGESLGETLKVMAGVNSIQTGPNISKPVIEGLSGNRVLIYNAGVRQEGQQWGSEHAPEVDPFIASQITVVKGASSVMYGSDAIGGVILVEPAPLNYSPGVSGKVNVVGMSNSGLAAVSGSLEGSTAPTSHFSWRIQATSRIAGNTKTPDYYLKNTGLREYNGALMLGYKNSGWSTDLYLSTFNTKLGIFSGSNVGSTDDRNNAISRPEPLAIYQSNLNYTIDRPYQQVNHHLAKLRSSYLFQNAGTLSLQYSYQQNLRREYDVVRASNEDKYQYKLDLNTQVADVYFEHQPIAGFSGRAGINGIYQHNRYDGAYLIPFFKSYSGAGYLIERWNKDNLELEGGLRYEYKWMQATKRISPKVSSSPIETPEFDFSQLSGTFGTAYKLPENYKLHFTIAKGWRPPAINELFIEGVHQGNASFERGDRNLKAESSLNFSAGISRNTGKLTGDLSIYYNRIDNYIYLQPQLDAEGNPIFEITQRGGFLAYQYVQLDARFKGLDAMLAYQLTDKLKITGKYAAVRARDAATGDHLIYIPADKTTGLFSYLLPDYHSFKSTTLDFSVTHVARQSRVRDNQDFAPAPKGYTLLDAAVSTIIPVGSHHWSLSLSVNNLLDKAYRDYLNRFRYYSDEMGRNIAVRLQIPFGKNKNSYTN